MIAERAYFVLCLAFGWMLRSAKYSSARILYRGGQRQVRKRRVFYAPLVIWIGGPLMKVLATGVRILPQKDWEQHERRIYWCLRGTSIDVDEEGALVLPFLHGETLANLLQDPRLDNGVRDRAIELAAVALSGLHGRGFTHGDAMAENVLVDLGGGVAQWFDFETVHDATWPVEWRRADDLRALLFTCLVRTRPGRHTETLQRVLNAYGDEHVIHALIAKFSSVLRRPLMFHLAQAPLSFQSFREAGRLLEERVGGSK